jgi:DNA-binding transcriptional MerR regulator
MVYSISDLAIEAGLSYDTVYYYIREELITESGRIGNRQRIFDEGDLEKLKRIVSLRKEGKSIDDIRNILEEEAANV